MHKLIPAAVIGVAVTALLLWLGPRPITPAERPTGDPAQAARIAGHVTPGHRNVSTFLLEDGTVTFAGLGADEHTEFEIGSVTKTFTAEIMANQIAAGRISEGTTVGDIIDAGDSGLADVTLRELADHTSGLPRLPGGTWVAGILGATTGGNPYGGETRESVIADARADELSDRGEEEYSNLGVALLGNLLAIEAGTTWEALVDEQILTPLGMADTYVMTDGAVSAATPRGLTPAGREAQPWEMGGYNPAGGVRSTAADIARYAEHLLDSGVPDYTWRTGEDGRPAHGGGTYGYSTMLILDPATGRAAYAAGDTATDVRDVAAALLEGEV